jgi:hypothetical protein
MTMGVKTFTMALVTTQILEDGTQDYNATYY